MKQLRQIVLGIALIAGSFGAGYYFRGKLPSADIEDYAVSNLLHDLATVGFLRANKIEELRGKVDVRISDDLTRVRKNAGAISSPEFLAARIRTLAGVARLWHETPPFQTKEFSTAQAQPWYPEWSAIQEANMKMIQTAESECRSTNCSPNVRAEPPNGPGAGARP